MTDSFILYAEGKLKQREPIEQARVCFAVLVTNPFSPNAQLRNLNLKKPGCCIQRTFRPIKSNKPLNTRHESVSVISSPSSSGSEPLSVKLLRYEGVQNLVAHFFRVSKFNQWKGLR